MSIFSRSYTGGQRIAPQKVVRRHKGASFMAVGPQYTTKRECRSYIAKNKLQNRYHYRIYGTRHHGYRIFVGPPKTSHGGIRKGVKHG